MKKHLFFFGILFLSLSCSSPDKKKSVAKDDNSFGALSTNIVETARTYLISLVKNPVITTSDNGVVTIRGEGKISIMNPNGISIGKIDSDESQDAIVTYFAGIEGKPLIKKHLILLNKNGLKIVRDFASELKVMWISNNFVYAQVPKLGTDAPGHDCSVCKEDVKFKLVADSLQLIK